MNLGTIDESPLQGGFTCIFGHVGARHDDEILPGEVVHKVLAAMGLQIWNGSNV